MKPAKPLLFALALALTAPALGSDSIPLLNWPVPRPPSPGIHTLADASGPLLFVPIQPCRLADTRNGSGFSGAYGAPAIAGGTQRTMSVTGGVCTGFPSTGVASVSANFTVVNPQGAGDIRTFPAGGSVPLVSTLNYVQGQTVANATIVPVSPPNAGLTIQVDVSTTDVIVDVNGYFVDGSSGAFNPGEYLGVVGTVDGGGVLFVDNFSTNTSDTTCAIRGENTSSIDGRAAILGEASGSAANFAVRGVNTSATSGAAGVQGTAIGRTVGLSGYFAAGVRGESTTGNGVLGLTNSGGSNLQVAVGGALLAPDGTTLASAYIGNASGPIGISFTGGMGGSGPKSFFEPHATDPTKMIRYVCLEGPEAGTYFRGRGRFVNGSAVIDVPETFRTVTDEEGLTVQITPIGRPASVAVVRMGLDRIEAEATRDVEFSFLVQGVRRAYKDFEIVTRNFFFAPRSPEDRLPASLSPEERRRLVANGTYNADGSVNLDTAERVGWARAWHEEEARRRAGTAEPAVPRSRQ